MISNRRSEKTVKLTQTITGDSADTALSLNEIRGEINLFIRESKNHFIRGTENNEC